MCGLVGVLLFNDSTFQITEPYIARMRDTMTHRGPDGAGIWFSRDRRVALGHRRLSIIDLSQAAAQPMSNHDETIWVVFNGEIYNHAEIRAELEKTRKYRWKTHHSDTEVILHAYEEWGIGCLDRFRGMFAIALWDGTKRELWLVRDRIGVKPLYYSVHNGRLVFASEIKALLADPEQRRSLNERAFYHFLSFLTTPAPDTMFDGIKKLPAGTWLRIKEDGNVTEQRYWDAWDHVNPLTGVPEEEIAERLLEELHVAVNLRKVSDVPVGIFLSGGVDSSTNAALFSEGGSKVKTFSIGYQGDYRSYQNELGYAKKMANYVGAEYHERILTVDDLIDFLPQMVRLQDEPIADPVCVPVYFVSKLARDNGVIVCQVGEGADELFCGYKGWQRLLSLEKYRRMPVPAILKKAGLRALAMSGKANSTYYEWLRRDAAGQPIFWSGAEAFTEAHKQDLLGPALRKRLSSVSSWEVVQPLRARFEQRAWETSDLNWMTYADLSLRLPELLLMRIDKMSMGASLEGRVPFLDHKFVELALSIPTNIKVKNGTLKYILKKAVRGIVPDEIIDRKKQGFGVPVYEWFFDKLGTQAKKTLEEFCDRTGFLDKRRVLDLIAERRHSQVWYLFNFALWWNEYVDA